MLRVVWILLMLLGALGLSLVALEVDGAAGAVEEGERQLAPAAAAAAAAVCIVEAGVGGWSGEVGEGGGICCGLPKRGPSLAGVVFSLKR